MPELPEVETTRNGIAPFITDQLIAKIVIRNHQLRWPIDAELTNKLPKQSIQQVTRRGKYLLLHCTKGVLIIHLGMSGSLRILQKPTVVNKHDHVDIILQNDCCLRFTDPRRFGCVLWTEENPSTHRLLKNLGLEPLTAEFTGDYLFQRAKGLKVNAKSFIMDGKIVVGVGNIYANEALFQAKIHPEVAVKNISKQRFQLLVAAIKKILSAAIKQGGTTLRDFTASDGKPGYFKQQLQVYGRGGLACVCCKATLQEIRLGQRSTVFCPRCQISSAYAIVASNSGV